MLIKIAEWFDHAADIFQRILLTVLTKLGPFAVAAMPALFSWWAIYETFSNKSGSEESGHILAAIFATVVALAFETVGVVIVHTTVELHNGTRGGYIDAWKFRAMLLMVPVYVFGVAGVVWFSGETFEPLVKALGIASPFLTVIVYLAVALSQDLNKQIRAFEQSDKQAHETELARTRQALDLEKARALHQMEMDKRALELKHSTDVERFRIEQQTELEKSKLSSQAAERPADSQPESVEYPTESEYPVEYAGYLADVLSQADGEVNAGLIQEITGLGRSTAYGIINYGVDAGKLHQAGRGKYKTNGKH